MRRALVLLLLVLGGCSGDEATRVVVSIDAEPQVKAQSSDIRLVVTDLSGDADRLVHDDRESPPKRTFPHQLTLQPSEGDATRTYRLEVRAVMGERAVATSRLISGYARGETRFVRVVLEDQCIDKPCGTDQTCSAGMCVDARLDVAGFGTAADAAPDSTSVPRQPPQPPADAGTSSTGVTEPAGDGAAREPAKSDAPDATALVDSGVADTGAALPDDDAPAPVRSPVTGAWAGTAEQFNTRATWAVTMALSSAASVGDQVGTIEYPGLGCGGILRRMADEPALLLVMREELTHMLASRPCVDRGIIRLQATTESNRIVWQWYPPASSQVGASATLLQRF